MSSEINTSPSPTSPESVFLEVFDPQWETNSGDDGIGWYEYGSVTGMQVDCWLESRCAGQVTLTWVREEAEEESEGFVIWTNSNEDIEVEVEVHPTGCAEVVIIGESRFLATQTFVYKGLGSKTFSTASGGREERDDDDRCQY